jgi:DNA-binding PadR family transcriptional regulator
MPRSPFLGDFEHLVLLALLRLGADAYGTSIRREIEAHAGRSISVGALYTALDRLERKGFAQSRLADPTPERGGRARRYYTLRPGGHAALRRSRVLLQRMWDGFEPEKHEA